MIRRWPGGDVHRIRELGTWQALEAYQAAFTTAGAVELAGKGRPSYHMRQAALESVIAERMRINAAISIHRAVLAGASVDELARAVGASAAEIAERWHAWADDQRGLNAQYPGVGVSARDYARAAATLQAGQGHLGAASTSGAEHANWSPRPLDRCQRFVETGEPICVP